MIGQSAFLAIFQNFHNDRSRTKDGQSRCVMRNLRRSIPIVFGPGIFTHKDIVVVKIFIIGTCIGCGSGKGIAVTVIGCLCGKGIFGCRPLEAATND